MLERGYTISLYLIEQREVHHYPSAIEGVSANMSQLLYHHHVAAFG
jgi:hypothetical protein